MSDPISVSRRRMLQIMGITSVGVVGAGALAACSPGTADNGNTSSTKPSGSSTAGGGAKSGGEIHVGYPFTAPPEGTFNMFAPANTIIDAVGVPYGDMLHMPSAYYLWADKSWIKFLVDDYKLDEAANTYTVTVKDGLTWSDGKPLTAKDYVTSFYCAWLTSQPVWKYVKDVEAKDDKTFVLTLKNPSTVLERYILKLKISDTQTYGAIADKVGPLVKAGKAASDPEPSALLAELQKLKPADPITSGPFKFDTGSITNTQLTLVKNDKGVNASKIKFDKVVIYNGETPDVTPLVQSKTVDYATHGFPPSTEKSFIAAGIRILRPPNLSGPALFMNFAKQPELKDKRVRQAFATLIDRAVVGKVSLAESGVGVKYMAGFTDNSVDEWLPAGVKDKLKTYDKDDAKAESLLKEAGWTKSGNSWKTPAGKDAAYELEFPAEFADWSAAGKNVAEQMTTFGIKVTPRGVNFAQVPVDADKGNFQMIIQAWGANSHPHPYFAYQADYLTHNYPIAKNNGGRGIDYDLSAVPGPDGKKYNIEEQITACGEGLDLDKQKTQIGILAQLFNEELPIIPLFERYGNNAAVEGVRVKKFPADDNPVLKNPAYSDNFVVIGIMDGTIEPV
jgi:peptide/nickel transport system substrate-binding protein